MTDRNGALALGLVGGSGAVLLGCLFLFLAGAPQRMIVMNFAALLIGLASVGALTALPPARPFLARGALLAAAAVLVATAVFGQSADGISRWLVVAGLTVQPNLILVPLIVLAFARRATVWSTAAVAIAAIGVAAQPDRGAAAMLGCAIAAAAAMRRERLDQVAAIAALAAFAATLLRADPLDPAPFVESVFSTAFAAHPLAAAAVLAGSALLFLPLLALRDAADRSLAAAFAACWAAALAAAALGHYPTPLVGFGGSAILGYMLAVATLRRPRLMPRAAQLHGASPQQPEPPHRPLEFASRSIG